MRLSMGAILAMRAVMPRAHLTATEVDILRGIAAAAIAPRSTRVGRKQRRGN